MTTRAKRTAAPKEQAANGLVRMVRDADEYPTPHTADVHPDEVANFKAGGWIEV